MESARTMFCSSPLCPPRTHHWNTLPSSSYTSVLMLREQVAPTVTAWCTSYSSQNFPTSVLLQEQCDEYRPLLHISKKDKTCQATLNTRQMDMVSVQEKNDTSNTDQVARDFRQHLHLLPRLENLLTSSQTGEMDGSSTLQHADSLQCNAVSLSKQAASVAEDLISIKADEDADNSIPFGLASSSSAEPLLGGNKTVRSTRLRERRAKERKVPKLKVKDKETYLDGKDAAEEKLQVQKKISKGMNQSDPLNKFLQSPESKQLLTSEQESQLVVQIQELLRLEDLKTSLQSQFGREPTMAEWAEGAGLNCRKMKAQLRCGNRSREKLIQANLRLVHYIAKSYQGRGLSIEDLLQEGSTGLIKSIKKFKTQAGCRFASYAYWWIKQAIRKAIYNHSRTIRLPEKVYNKLSKVLEAKKLYKEEGNLNPTKEELARRVGISPDKVDRLLFVARIPISMQNTVGSETDTTFQEITADCAIESPNMSVAKQLMRRHVLNVLNILRPKERRIIRLRFGFEDGEEKSLSEIGEIFGLSRERVRQLESRALYKLKKYLVGQGLDAYADLLI
ncbi:putative RNA polymerase sigma-70 like domain, RNA polymerase sigma-B/F/G type [Medicago truncatula]|uniref:Putative RNA polymerase sigma-70 like domain, RNA polymerase sigma-B/F/G type n=1 Tax=Medicago truncatula TaxID=3880 RepID=G7IA88_MEDTR|nr:RNA polymerase sigma factor sigF, chloroplastic [Medicago truncatula]AES60705.2 RNA polymerase sigma factor [Medicago truncatula]RHN79764.1 putative RNA polymerase sigma-70 like domain, RNA polymerase sigma-B/F/G type [Medicago truncatula]